MNDAARAFITTNLGRRSHITRWFLVLVIAVFSGFIGEIYGTLVYGADGGDYYRGFRAGFSIGLISAAIEVFYIRSYRRSWIRRVAFLPGLIVRILVLTLIIRVALVSNELLTNYLNGDPLRVEVNIREQVRDTLFSMVLVVMFVMLSQLTTIIGFKRFISLVSGRYFRPVTEKRVFLFVDLIGSSELARSLGNVRFHEYLSEFFYHLDQSIVRAGGEIVSYVGDAVIVTWPLGRDRERNARCLIALDAMLHNLESQKDEFQQEFGEVPRFRAALHGGSVVVGECGDSRKQVTFLGDVVNMTARIEEATKREGEQFLASDEIISQMEPPENVRFELFGEIELKGANEPFTMHRIVFSQLEQKPRDGVNATAVTA